MKHNHHNYHISQLQPRKHLFETSPEPETKYNGSLKLFKHLENELVRVAAGWLKYALLFKYVENAESLYEEEEVVEEDTVNEKQEEEQEVVIGRLFIVIHGLSGHW